MGAVAADDRDGVITATMNVVGSVDTSKLGVYTLKYNVSDSAGNAASEVVRTVTVVDTLAPVITLVGEADFAAEAGVVYVDAGASAADIFDGDLTESISTNSTVDTNKLGEYTVIYEAVDAAGNKGSSTRKVTVADTLAPVITLKGQASVNVEAGDVYIDAGAIAADSFEGDLTDSIVTTGSVDTAKSGTYILTYNVGDTTGNSATAVVRTVVVEDSTVPVISLNGETEVTAEAGSTYTDAGATASDTLDGDLTASIVSTGAVDTSTLGVYTLSYNVSDKAGNNAVQVTSKVTVADSIVPTITLKGDSEVTLEVGDTYTEAGATVSDSFEGDLTSKIVINGTVDTAKTGTYTITYNVSDTSGNAAKEVVRTVELVDTTAPVLTLLGEVQINVEAGVAFTDPGATAMDNLDGDLTDEIAVTGSVDTAKTGDYTLTYTVNDAVGNKTEVIRNVTVADTLSPVLTLVGDADITVEAGSSYNDSGVTAIDSFDIHLSLTKKG